MTVVKEILVGKSMKQTEYYMAAVLYLLSGKTANVKVVGDNEVPTYEIAEYREMIKSAVPGSNSMLMDLAIKSNVSEAVLDDSKKGINEKIHSISERIQKFVVIKK